MGLLPCTECIFILPFDNLLLVHFVTYDYFVLGSPNMIILLFENMGGRFFLTTLTFFIINLWIGLLGVVGAGGFHIQMNACVCF